MTLTIGDKLDNERKRWGYRISARLIAEPAVRLRYLADDARAALRFRDNYWSDDPRYDNADADYQTALDAFRAEAKSQRRWRMPAQAARERVAEMMEGVL